MKRGRICAALLAPEFKRRDSCGEGFLTGSERIEGGNRRLIEVVDLIDYRIDVPAETDAHDSFDKREPTARDRNTPHDREVRGDMREIGGLPQGIIDRRLLR